jgi:hypothetical protein
MRPRVPPGAGRRCVQPCTEGASPYALSGAWFIPINVRVYTPCIALAALKVNDCRQNRGGWPLRWPLSLKIAAKYYRAETGARLQ